MRATSRTLEHVGEWRVAVTADTREELFAELARVIARAAGPARGAPGEWEHVRVSAPDDATLLADWANELLGRTETAGIVFDDVRDVRLVHDANGASVNAEVRGRPAPPRFSPLKAATYHALSLAQRDGRWHATLLFDV